MANMFANFAPNSANPASEPQPTAENSQLAADGGGATANEALQYYNEGRAAFTRGDYREA